MQQLILFLLSFLFILVIYEIFIVSKAKKNEKKKIENKQPVEVKYLMAKYKLNLKKINYHELLHVCALVSSFDMALIVSLAHLFENSFLENMLPSNLLLIQWKICEIPRVAKAIVEPAD